MNNNEIKDDELNKVSGGFGVTHDDYCHFEPSKWVKAGSFTYFGDPTNLCRTCIYNPHRNWAQSSCEYNEQNAENTGN